MGSFIVFMPIPTVAADAAVVVPLEELGRPLAGVGVVMAVVAAATDGVVGKVMVSSPGDVDDEATIGTTGIGIDSLDPEPSKISISTLRQPPSKARM